MSVSTEQSTNEDKVKFITNPEYGSGQTVKASRGDHDVPHERYIPVNRLKYDSQDQVALAWALGFYPKPKQTTVSRRGIRRSHEKEITRRNLYSSENFKGQQNNDGSGVLRHYNTREAIRTQSGLIISNVQCWSAGFAKCSTPPSDMIDYQLPLDAIENMASDQGERINLVELTEDNFLYYESSREFILQFGDFAIMVGADSSSLHGRSRFVCYLEMDELVKHEAYTVQAVMDRIMKPDEVKQAEQDGLVVRDSSEFTQTTFRNPSDEVIEREGLEFDSESYNGDQIYRNHKAYLPSLQGDCIVRQGEYFFIPTELPENAGDFCMEEIENGAIEVDPALWEESGTWNSASMLGSHNASEMKITLTGELYVRGSVTHDSNDHNMISLGDTWHRVVTHGIPSLSVDTGPRNGGTQAD